LQKSQYSVIETGVDRVTLKSKTGENSLRFFLNVVTCKILLKLRYVLSFIHV